MDYYILFLVCVTGLCLGSFFNVVILRSLSGESIVFPPSKCPKCNHKLYFWHNIPVLSYIFLRGKCWFCKEKISIQYPIVETITMLLFGAAYIKFGVSMETLCVLFFISCLIIMTVTDLREKIVDCNIAIAMGLIGFFYHGDIIGSILGVLAAIFILEVVARAGIPFTGSRAMGEADTYIAGAFGIMFGINNIITVLLCGLIAAMVFILPVFLYNQYRACRKGICIMSVIFILAVLVFRTIDQNYFTMAAVALSGIVLAVMILKSMKKGVQHIPFVPALTAGALYFIFFNVNFLS